MWTLILLFIYLSVLIMYAFHTVFFILALYMLSNATPMPDFPWKNIPSNYLEINCCIFLCRCSLSSLCQVTHQGCNRQLDTRMNLLLPQIRVLQNNSFCSNGSNIPQAYEWELPSTPNVGTLLMLLEHSYRIYNWSE